MSEPFSYKTSLLAYRASGKMSKDLYLQLSRLIQIVLRAKGVESQTVIDDVHSAFFEKLLKFKGLFYTKLALYDERQVRSFLSLTIGSVLMDFYRREKLDRVSSLDLLEPYEQERLQPEETWNNYKLEAYSIYKKLWQGLSQELKEIFCLVYDAGHTVEEVAALRSLSLGKIHKDKVRISQVIAPEASIEEVAQMVYRLMAIEFCCKGQPKA